MECILSERTKRALKLVVVTGIITTIGEFGFLYLPDDYGETAVMLLMLGFVGVLVYFTKVIIRTPTVGEMFLTWLQGGFLSVAIFAIISVVYYLLATNVLRSTFLEGMFYELALVAVIIIVGMGLTTVLGLSVIIGIISKWNELWKKKEYMSEVPKDSSNNTYRE